jgi:signal transduction histidine kinase
MAKIRMNKTAGKRLESHLLGEVGDAIRKPLWTIMASAQVLLKSRDLTPRDARVVDRIDANAHRLARIVGDLLDHALGDVGVRMPLAPRATDMRRIAEEALLEARIDHPDRWIALVSGGDGSGHWDHDRVVQLVSHLLEHALGRSSKGTPVSFTWRGEEGEVVIEIEYAPNSAGARREIGLGVGVARHIARAHGGDLGVGETSAGVLLTVVLPRQGSVRRSAESARRREDAVAGEARQA